MGHRPQLERAAADPQPLVTMWKYGSSVDSCSEVSKELPILDFHEQSAFKKIVIQCTVLK